MVKRVLGQGFVEYRLLGFRAIYDLKTGLGCIQYKRGKATLFNANDVKRVSTVYNTAKGTLAMAAIVCLMLSATYMGITNDLCSRIHTFDTHAQSTMKLSVDTCKNTWYVR